MRLPAIDPEARAFLAALPQAHQERLREALADLEEAAADREFAPTDFGLPVPGIADMFATRVGAEGQWYVYWRKLPDDPTPLRRIHVLRIEPAPPLRPL